MQRELWIGLVHLKPLDRKAHDFAGAYTNVIAWAECVEGFERKAAEIAAELGFYVVEVEDAEPMKQRFADGSMPEEMEEMAMRAERGPDAIVYDTFHCYPFDDA